MIRAAPNGVTLSAGEAHGEHCVGGRRIGTSRELPDLVLLADTVGGAASHTTVDQTSEASHQNGSRGATSSSQWFVGRTRHPSTVASDASPLLVGRSES